jgi:group I intron endonuclease
MLNSLIWIPLQNIRKIKTKCGIYCLRNKITQKLYIGKTKGKFYYRLGGHIHEAFKRNSEYAIHGSIRCYGIDNFEVAIILHNIDEFSLNDIEKYYIKLLNTKTPVGYNMTDGGEGTTGYVYSIETRKLISFLRKGIPMLQSTKLLLGKAVIKFNLKTNEEIERYDAISYAQFETGILNIGMCCKGRLKSAGGFGWKFVDEEKGNEMYGWDDETKDKMKNNWNINYASKFKRVAMCDLITRETIRIFNSIKEMYEELKIPNVSAVCRGVRKSAGGYFWKFV